MSLSTINVKGILDIRGFSIKKKIYPEKVIDKIRNFFHVVNTVDDKEVSVYDLSYEDKKYITIPKFYANKNIEIILMIIDDIKYDNIQFECSKCKYESEKININFTGIMRDYQMKCIDTIMKLFNKCKNSPKGGMLKFSCGMGKTLMAIYLAHVLGLKTLIIVHMGNLLDQWIERFQQFTNATIGIIRQDKLEIDKDICIATVQTICSRNYDTETFKKFGLVIFDEAHHYGSQQFSNVLKCTSAEYTIGLSATPVRKDEMMYIIHWCIGEIIYKLKKKFDYRIMVKRIFFDSENSLFVDKLKKYNGKMTSDSIKMMTNLTKNNIRNNLIINVIDALKKKGRKIFIFSDRIEHLKILKEGTDEIITANDEHHMFKTCLYIGACKKAQRKEAEKSGDIIFATLKIAEEGLDISRLDTLIFALPLKQEKTLEQSTGRILRLEKYDDLINIPLVIDICDKLSLFQRWADCRMEYYNKEDWYVENYHFKDTVYMYNKGENMNDSPYKIMFDNIDSEDFIEKHLIKNNDMLCNIKEPDEKVVEKKIDVMSLLYPTKKPIL